MKTPEQIYPDWARYAETILSFAGEPSLEVDLRESLTEAMRASFKERGLSGTFAIMTAYDPHGRNLSAEENMVQQSRLEGELQAGGLRFIHVNACSVDRKHCECSLAIDVDQERAVEIAARYEQMAIFWYDADAIWLIGAGVESDPMRLPRSA